MDFKTKPEHFSKTWWVWLFICIPFSLTLPIGESAKNFAWGGYTMLFFLLFSGIVIRFSAKMTIPTSLDKKEWGSRQSLFPISIWLGKIWYIVFVVFFASEFLLFLPFCQFFSIDHPFGKISPHPIQWALFPLLFQNLLCILACLLTSIMAYVKGLSLLDQEMAEQTKKMKEQSKIEAENRPFKTDGNILL